MISPERFLALLEKKELLPPRTVASLREQIAKSDEPVTAAALAKQLIKHGRITPAQAKRLLAGDEEKSPSRSPMPQPESDELGFAPIDGEKPEKERKDKSEKEPRVKSDSAAKQPRAPAAPARFASADSLLDEEVSLFGEDVGNIGSLDGIMSDDTMGAGDDNPLAATSSSSGLWSFLRRLFTRKPRGPKKTDEEKWGGSLMLMGGGGLVVLILACVFLFYVLNSTSSDKFLELAHAEYRSSSYTQAIAKYKAFLEKFPSAKETSLVRVRIGLAKLRQATSSGANWSAAIQVAEDELKTMSPETDFKEAHSELASMLSSIAEGLVAEARKKPTMALVNQTKQSLAMIEKYVPKTLRPESKLNDVRASLGIAERELARGNELDKTIVVMQKATKELKTADAYAACSSLLHQYPDLSGDSRLKQTLLAVSMAQQGLVKTVSEIKPAAKAEIETAAIRSVTLSQSDVKAKVADVDGQVTLAAVDGAVYGLDAATGRVLWRRFVGFDANPQAPSFPPTFLSSEPGSDVLVVATAHNELLRLDGAAGRVRWRCVVGEPFDAHPVIGGGKILVATRGGKLITINADSGESPGYTKFPQELDVAPTVDVRRSLIYQVAAHTNLFILSLDQAACKHVDYLGHEPAGITTAPVMVDDYLLVVVNDGAHDAVLKVFTVQQSNRSDKPEPWLKLIQEIRLGGHIPMSPLVEGRRVLVSTDAGVVRVFELSAADAKTPFRDVAKTAVEDEDASAKNLTRFALMQNGQFWIADNRLTKYDVQAARGRLSPKWIDSADSAYLQPPVAVGQAVVSVRRKQGMPGAIVSAVAMQNAVPFWETRIASPLAGEPIALASGGKNDGRLVAVTANGGVFKVDSNQTDSTILGEPILVSDPYRIQQPVKNVIRLAEGLLAISDGKGGDNVGVFDPSGVSPMIYWVEVPGKGKLACSPAAFGRGILLPTKGGQVFWLDSNLKKIGEPLAEPFQPRIEPGIEVNWTIPAVVSDTQVALGDGQTTIYLLEVKNNPRSHLASRAQTVITKPIDAPPAVLSKTIFVGNTAGAMSVLAIPTLTHGNKIALGGRCVWGPACVGDNVLASTDDNRLLCFDAKGTKLWSVALDHGPLAGAPVRLGDHLLLASRSGIVWRAEVATGKELGKVDAGYPLATGPVLCGQKLLVGGHDGTLYEVRQP